MAKRSALPSDVTGGGSHVSDPRFYLLKIVGFQTLKNHSEYGTMIYAVRCRPFSEMPTNGSSPGFFKASGVYADFIVPSYSGSFRL